MSIKTKKSTNLNDTVSTLVSAAIFILVLGFPSLSLIGFFLAYPYTTFVVLAVIALLIGGLLKILHTPNALATGFIGTSLGYVLLNICRVFTEISNTFLSRFVIVVIVALIGFTGAIALLEKLDDKRKVSTFAIALPIIATFSLGFLNQLDGSILYGFHL